MRGSWRESTPGWHTPGGWRSTSNLARRLVDGQFPQWAELPIRPVDHDGWDNRTFRLGDG